jgi:hypothetical protein
MVVLYNGGSETDVLRDNCHTRNVSGTERCSALVIRGRDELGEAFLGIFLLSEGVIYGGRYSSNELTRQKAVLEVNKT